MSKIPKRFRVQLQRRSANPPLINILVSLQFFLRGKPYYSDRAGLTDEGGMVELARDTLEDDFRYDQNLFPMDFKEPLDACDPVVEAIVRGGDEFAQMHETVEHNRLVVDAARIAYAAARNREVESVRVRMDFVSEPMELVTISVPIRSASVDKI
jgi:hypothetical protein